MLGEMPVGTALQRCMHRWTSTPVHGVPTKGTPGNMQPRIRSLAVLGGSWLNATKWTSIFDKRWPFTNAPFDEFAWMVFGFFAAEPVFNVELLLLKLSMLFLMMVLTTTVMIMTTFWMLCRLHDDNCCIISSWCNRFHRSHCVVSVPQVRTTFTSSEKKKRITC